MAMAFKVDKLSDEELRQSLREHGLKDVGPIQDTTRSLYRQQLKKRMREASRDRGPGAGTSGGPTKKRRVGDSPSQSPHVKYVAQGRGHSSRLEQHHQSPIKMWPRQKEGGANAVFGGGVNRPMPKLTQVDLEEPYDGIGMSLELGGDIDTNFTGMSPGGMRMSPGGMRMNEDDVDSYDPPHYRHDNNLRHSGIELGFPLPRKPIGRQRSGSGQWLGVSLSNTARMIGEGVKSFVSSLITPPNLETTPPNRHHRSNERRPMRSHDSVDMGGGELPSPEPSAPSLPPDNTVTHYDWELLPSDVQICQHSNGTNWHLGKGGFGEVFKGIKDGVDEVAIKVIKLENHASSIEQFKQEIDLISKLRHRNILQFYGACIKPHCLYMVTELMQCDLFTALRTDARYKWAGPYGKEICVGIATGLHYLHSRRPPIVHRDIKSPNVLLMDGLAKIADVGIARAKWDSDMTAQRGFTIAWAAPEVVYRRRATEKIDIWSFGVVLWEVVTGRPPHPGRLVMPLGTPEELRVMFGHCTNENPSHRPVTSDLLVSLKNM